MLFWLQTGPSTLSPQKKCLGSWNQRCRDGFMQTWILRVFSAYSKEPGFFWDLSFLRESLCTLRTLACRSPDLPGFACLLLWLSTGIFPSLRVEKCVILQGQLRCPVPRSLLLAASLTLRHLCPVLSHLGQHLSACWAHFIKMGIGEVCSFTETSASWKQRPFLICRIIWVYVTPTMTAINENIIITSY